MLKSQTSGDAAAEARSFFSLLKSGRATLPQIRSQIGYHTPYRRRILLCFDVLRGEVTPELRTAILSLLRANSLLAVSHKLSVPYKVVRKVSKEGHARFHKIGRGRKLASETEECILDRIRADARSVDLRREFGVSDWYVQKLRRSIGDTENRLFRRGWNEQKVKEALQNGLSISEVERDCGIQHAVLWKLRKKIGDTEDRRPRRRGPPSSPTFASD